MGSSAFHTHTQNLSSLGANWMSSSNQTKTKILLDVDPGHDDAMAMILAQMNDSIDLIGVVTVYGNQSIEKTTRNVRSILSLMDASQAVPVIQGASRPLLGRANVCAEIHGDSGLDSVGASSLLSPNNRDRDRDRDEQKSGDAGERTAALLRRSFDDDGRPVTIVACGALTNVALLLAAFPSLVGDGVVDGVVFMGGSIGNTGNMSPSAEFNMMIDPHAAQMVLESGVRAVQMPLDVSHTALITADVRASIADALDGADELRECILGLLDFFAATYLRVFGMAAPPLHDPLTVAYVIAPHLFDVEEYRVDVELASPLCRGLTCVDVFAMSKLPKNCTVAKSVDVDAFWQLMFDAFRSLKCRFQEK
jgi:inosine/uridine nucleosidase